MQRSPALTVIRFFLATVFIAYGVVKLLGGQFFYGDWTMEKHTVGGPFLVWAFYGYSPAYARFIAFAELIPGILLLIPRTATLGAAALFAVSLNVTVMDFAFGFPTVKYAALVYTLLLAVLLWADRRKLLLLVTADDRLRAIIPGYPAPAPARVRRRRGVRVVGTAAATLFVLFVANLVATGVDAGPEAAAREVVARSAPPGAHIELVRSRYSGGFGVNRTATIDFVVTDAGSTDSVRVTGRKAMGFTPWRIDDVTR
jgi:uncharacterized membrane protein YphA (DoxX/SURF4 family)